MLRKYWEEFLISDTITTQALTVTETHVVLFTSLTGDWYPLQTDEEYAKQTSFQGRIAHGPLIFSLAVGLMGLSNPFGDTVIAWIGADKLRATTPVKIGDTIHVNAHIIDKKETSRRDRGTITFKYVVKNQQGKEVMEFEFSFLVYRKPAGA